MARRGVDYNQGANAVIAQQYQDLMRATELHGEAENRRKAENIEREGLFGTGIRQSDIESFGKLAVTGAKLGHGRMDQKMNLAKDSFQRRMDEGKDRIEELRRFGDEDSINEIRAIQAGMSEERNKFENLMSDYEGSGIWGSRFGTKGVGYKGTGEMSSFMKEFMKSKSDRDAKRRATLADESRRQQHQTSPLQSLKRGDERGDRIDRYSEYPHRREFEKMDYETGGDGGMPEQPQVGPQEGKRHPFALRNNLGGVGLGSERQSPAQSRSYGSEASEKFGPRTRVNPQGGMPSQSQLEDKYGRGAYRVKGLMNREPYKHTFGDQYSRVEDIDFWEGV